MEIKEYIKIFKKHYKLFLVIVLSTITVGIFVQVILPAKYKVSIDINVTRLGYQKNTNDYRYDSFYRLQADEKFADTVVRWIDSPRIQTDISEKLKNISFEKLKARRLSSQMINVTFLISQPDRANEVTKIMEKLLNNQTKELNKYQQDPNWFKLLISKPVVSNYKLPIEKLIIILLFAGIFIGFWGVFIKNYFE